MFVRRALLALGVLTGGALAQAPCSEIRLLFKASPEAPMPGKSLRVAYTLSNKSNLKIASSAVSIMLPKEHVTYTTSSSRPMGSAGTLAGSAVTWAAGGAVNAGKSKTFMAEMGVGAGAQVLLFDAGATVVLSDGTTCALEAPESAVHAKGYKQAIPPSLSKAAASDYGLYPVGLRLDAQTPGADGYVEQIILSREGLDVVFACMLKDKAPPALKASQNSAGISGVNYALFIRPSKITSPGIAPVDSWWGYCEGNGGSDEFTPRSGQVITESLWCVGDYNGTPLNSQNFDYSDNDAILMNRFGGRLAMTADYGVRIGLNWDVTDQAACYVSTDIQYTPSGTAYPY